ncbi:uncharacterized protein NEPG_00180 [Nematocida parisii ERTm1]|uniref:Uncharacterized protein n=1 Tax=Nematocida parisii (strain ERTm3) TaxID=935791 RepID=I3EGQ7_NEMP3|nr:uncharacterized protein NEPG_00180 [Nematocida parisii ERTm1]EIJ88404.1 hypothetical protein NEQG_01094 [Nematocida parisii ERTm3]EIJ94657.1 hypothetical protein NEPG_00180 [Nematocida parisii ERTm1]|eukprot:XP_013058013.1 hypothetical protein NEPG_00180 [Nematocida parisii ERTm1]
MAYKVGLYTVTPQWDDGTEITCHRASNTHATVYALGLSFGIVPEQSPPCVFR